MGLNVLVAAFNKYGFGNYTYKIGAGRSGTGTQVDCSALVQWSLKDSGYNIGTFNTNDPKIGLFSQATGKVTAYAKQYFDEVAIGAGAYQPGDVVVYRNINGGPGHMGIFIGYDDFGYPIFYGSQSGSKKKGTLGGPGIVDAKTSYWNVDPMELVGVLRPKDGAHTGIDTTVPPTEGTGLAIPNMPSDQNLHYYRFDNATEQRRLYDNGIIYIKDTQTNQEFWSIPTETGGEMQVTKFSTGLITTVSYDADGNIDATVPATVSLDASASADVKAAFDAWVAAGNDPSNVNPADLHLDQTAGGVTTLLDSRLFSWAGGEYSNNAVLIGESPASGTGGDMLRGGIGNQSKGSASHLISRNHATSPTH